MDMIYTPIVGDLVGNRTWDLCGYSIGCVIYNDSLGDLFFADIKKAMMDKAYITLTNVYNTHKG